MTEPTDLNKFKKAQTRRRGKETTLCRRGFHKWMDEPRKQFDVKAGKLVSEQVCTRCGKRKSTVS